MSSIAISLLVLVCVLGAAVIGFVLPGQRLDSDSKDSLKTAIGLVGTLTALVLGLLVGTAKSSYNAKSDGLTQVTTDIILLDRMLDQYGPAALQARSAHRDAATQRLEALWGKDGVQLPGVDPRAATARLGEVERTLRELKPENERQRAIQSQALTLMDHQARALLLTAAQVEGSIPNAFVVVLSGWLVIMFVGIGALAPGTATARTGVLAAAIAFSTALFLILEMDTPYGGVIQISNAPVRLVLEHLAK